MKMRFLGVSLLLVLVLGGLDAQRKTRTERCQAALGQIEGSEAAHAARVKNLKNRLAKQDESMNRSWITKYFNGVEANGTHERSCEELSSQDADIHRKTRCQKGWDRIKRLKVNYAQRVEKFKLRLAGQREASKRRWIKKYFNGVEPELPWTTCAEMLSRNAEQTQTKEVQTEEVQSQEFQSGKDPTEEAQTEKVPTEEVLNEEANTGKDPSEEAQTEKVTTEEAQAGEVPAEEVLKGKDPTEEAAETPTEETLTEQCQRQLDTINKIEAVRVQKVEERKEYLASRYEWEMIILIRKYFHGFDPMEPLTTCEKMLPTFPGEGRPLVRYVRPDIRPDVRPDGRRDARQDRKRRLLLARYRRQEELRLKELEKLSSKEADELRLKKLRLKKEKERECQELLDQSERKKAATSADLEKYRESQLRFVKWHKKGIAELFFNGVEPAEPWTTCAVVDLLSW